MGGQNLKPPSKLSLNGHSIMILCLVLIVFFIPRHATAGLFSDLSTYAQDNSFAEYDSYERNPYYAMGQNNSAIEYLLFNPDSYFVFDQRSEKKLGLTKRHSFAMTPMTLDLNYEDKTKGEDAMTRWMGVAPSESETASFSGFEFNPSGTWFIGGEYQKVSGVLLGDIQVRVPLFKGFFRPFLSLFANPLPAVKEQVSAAPFPSPVTNKRASFIPFPSSKTVAPSSTPTNVAPAAAASTLTDNDSQYLTIRYETKFWNTWVGRNFEVFSLDIRPKVGLTVVEFSATGAANIEGEYQEKNLDAIIPLPRVGIDVVKSFDWFTVKASYAMAGIDYRTYGARAPSMMVEIEKELFSGSSLFINYRKSSYHFWDTSPDRPIDVKFQQDGFMTGFAYEF